MYDDQPNYSSYISYHTMGSNTYSLFMGFTFTSMVVFLTWLPDPTQNSGSVFFEFSLSHLGVSALSARSGSVVTRLSNFAWYMLSGITVLMFFVWNLPILALGSAVVGIALMAWAKRTADPFYKAVTENWARK